jgi:hypothetical protein
VAAGVAQLRVGHGRLDRAVPEKVPHEVYSLARVEEVDSGGMAKDANMAGGDW